MRARFVGSGDASGSGVRWPGMLARLADAAPPPGYDGMLVELGRGAP